MDLLVGNILALPGERMAGSQVAKCTKEARDIALMLDSTGGGARREHQESM